MQWFRFGVLLFNMVIRTSWRTFTSEHNQGKSELNQYNQINGIKPKKANVWREN